jgi:hypothetical protein
VFVGVSQLIVYTNQAGTMRDQLQEMKAQRLLTVVQLRANVRRERPVMHPVGNNGKYIGIGEALFGWDVNPVWTNVGYLLNPAE